MADGKNSMIDISELRFDPKNPRVPSNLRGEKREPKIIDYMIKFGNVTEVMYSIAELGYSDAEPLLVIQSKINEYIVVEGNRRLAALKLLNNPELAKIKSETIYNIASNAVNKPTKIPCIVYENRNDILDYLGYRHITGVKEWGALEKATYLNELYENHKNDGLDQVEIYRKIAQMIGSRMDHVRKLHMSFKLYLLAEENCFYGISDQYDISFSWLTTALGYSQIQDFIGLSKDDYTIDRIDTHNFEKLFKWMFSKRTVPESRRIGDLAEVIGSESAIKKLENGYTLDQALLYTNHPECVFTQLLQDSRDKLREAYSQIEPLKENPQEAEALLSDISKLAKMITGALQGNFGDSE